MANNMIIVHPTSNEQMLTRGDKAAPGIEVIWNERLHGPLPEMDDYSVVSREDYEEQAEDIDGNPLYVKVPVLDENGDPTFETITDDEGNEYEAPVMEDDLEQPVMLQKHRLVEDAAKAAPQSTIKNDRQWIEVRQERDKLISEVMWEYERNSREKRLGLTPTRDDAWMDSLDVYVQALADIPQSESDPFNITWPVKP